MNVLFSAQNCKFPKSRTIYRDCLVFGLNITVMIKYVIE